MAESKSTQDHETENQPTTIDISTIENHKENIQPLASGRSAAQLSSLFQKGLSNSHSTGLHASQTQISLSAFNPITLAEQLRGGHQEFQKDIDLMDKTQRGEIQSSEESQRGLDLLKDPLDIYVQYVRWIIESYPSGGTTADSKLIPLLEQSTRKFVSDARYHQDQRYLKLWVYYAQQVQREAARTIFSFLLHKKIGIHFSLLYEEFSNILSQFKDYEKAKHVLELGIGRKASPLERLLNRLADVQEKLDNNLSKPTSFTEVASKPASNAKAGLSKKPVKGKMKIFEDGANGQASIPGQITRWDEIGTVDSNRKQNTVEPTAWKGQKLPMKLAPSGAPSARPPKMKIFEDSEAGTSTPNIPSTLAQHPESDHALADPGRSSGPSDYEALKTDPFRYHSSWDEMKIRML